MNAKDKMIDDYSYESPWLALAKRIVRMDVARKAQQKEVPRVQPQKIVQ